MHERNVRPEVVSRRALKVRRPDILRKRMLGSTTREGFTMSDDARNAETVRRYFDGCQSGAYDDLIPTLDPDVMHYFLPTKFPPIRGADALARY